MVLQRSRDNAWVAQTPSDLARRVLDRFNRDFGEMPEAVPADTRALFTEEPLIVPLRAALEGTVYSGPDALESFLADSSESWEWLRVDAESFEDFGEEACVVTGTLNGCGRATGAETTMAIHFALEFDAHRAAAIRTFASRREAVEAASA